MKWAVGGMDRSGDVDYSFVVIGPFDTEEQAITYGADNLRMYETLPMFPPRSVQLECGHTILPDDSYDKTETGHGFYCAQCQEEQDIIETGPKTGDVMKKEG